MNIRSIRMIAVFSLVFSLLAACTGSPQPEPITISDANRNVMVVFLKLSAPFCSSLEKCLPDFPQVLQDRIHPPRHSAVEYANLFNSTVSAFIREATYSNERFNFTAIVNPASSDGWFDAPHSLEDYNQSQSASMGQDAYDDAVSTIGDEVQNYDVLLVITNIQSLFGYTTGINGISLMVIGENPDDTSIYEVLAHELGHVLTLEHVILGPYDIVGNSDVLVHYGGWSKIYAGWVPHITDFYLSDGVDSVTTWLDPIERPGNNVLRIHQYAESEDLIFGGYIVECRVKNGFDANIPKEGLVITSVYYMNNYPEYAARLVFASSDYSFVQPPDYSQAPLSPGESFYFQNSGLTITYLQKDGQDRCQVKATSEEVVAPDPMIKKGSTEETGAGYNKYDSGDIWIDSLQNGWDDYPPDTMYLRVDGKSIPTGYGDPFWVNHENRIKFLVRNLGNSDAENVIVDVYVTQPIMIYIPGVTCDGPELNEANRVATVSIDHLGRGDVYFGEVPWTPGNNSAAQVKVVIRDHAGEITNLNNSASETYARQNANIENITANIHEMAALETPNLFDNPVAITAQVYPTCTERIPYKFIKRVINAIDRKEWVMNVPFFEGWLDPGRMVEIPLASLPPEDAQPGDCELVELEFYKWSQDLFTHFSGLTFKSCVVEPTNLTCTVPDGSIATGSSVNTGGRLSPAEGGETIALEYTDPAGGKIIQHVKTGPDGNFTDSILADKIGTWQMQAFWQGTDKSAAAESMVCAFNIETGAPQLTLTSEANCRKGPGTAYELYGYGYPGDVMAVLASSRDGLWLYGVLNGYYCWASRGLGELNVDIGSLTERDAPPLPVLPTITPDLTCSIYTNEALCNRHKDTCQWVVIFGGACVRK